MQLIVKCSPSRQAERRYILSVILTEFLGLDFKIVWEERNDYCIQNGEEDNIRIADILLKMDDDKWLQPLSLPQTPLSRWKLPFSIGIPLADKGIPIIYGQDEHGDCMVNDQQNFPSNNNCINIDIFGSAFFMLTRYEEYVKKDHDTHNRFPASASLAYQEGFLDIPIINIYIEVLWWYIAKIWPQIRRKQHSYKIMTSHDIDIPFAQALSGTKQLIRNCGGDILVRKSPGLAVRRIKSWPDVKSGNYKRDINYTFDYIMNISERNGIKSAFYFKTAGTNTNYDDPYSIDHPYVRGLIQDISHRSHEIGIHPSYESYNSLNQISKEYCKLRQVCDEEGIKQDIWGGRQHFLRWRVPLTWRYWAAAGLDYDTTLTYAEHAGFRCGICYDYHVFDLEKQTVLPLVERPLIVMECSVLDNNYMGLVYDEALAYLKNLKEMCRIVKGNFTILWHNSSLIDKVALNTYQRAIED